MDHKTLPQCFHFANVNTTSPSFITYPGIVCATAVVGLEFDVRALQFLVPISTLLVNTSFDTQMVPALT